MSTLLNSTFLDAYGNQLATAQDFATLASSTSLSVAQQVLAPLFAGATIAPAATDATLVVGLTLERMQDPTPLLASDWATRQAALADPAAVWAQYGASSASFAATQQALESLLGLSSLPTLDGYLSSPENRTIWLSLDAAEFEQLFGTDLLTISTGTADILAWAGNLTLDDTIPNIDGVWFEQAVYVPSPAVLASQGAALPPGPLGIGNAAGTSTQVIATPAAIAANYDFPLSSTAGQAAATPAIALIEDNVPYTQAALFGYINQYRTQLGLQPYTASEFQVISQDGSAGSPGELTLDISVIADAAPNSTQYLYSYMRGTPFTAFQQAFFATTNRADVLSSSYAFFIQPSASSPFQQAYEQLFVDGVLSNVSVHLSAGDQGSSADLANGLANYRASQSPTYALAVGGTSLSSLYSAETDPTLSSLLARAQQNDPATVFDLVAAGLQTLPTNLVDTVPSDPSPTLVSLFESIWQTLDLEGYDSGVAAKFGENTTGVGGVNTALPVPDYQSAFGLLPTSTSGTGRGAPDVALLAFGNTAYGVLNQNYISGQATNLIHGNGGTSAASPLWASLTAQLDAVFADQTLGPLGYYNDLLYMAAAIAPASFNDITLGNNINSFYLTTDDTGYFQISQDSQGQAIYTPMVPTGLGYEAAPGYDLASGLGTPNGMVLARTLTAIAQAQTYYEGTPVIDNPGPYSGTSGASQTLLVQNNFATSGPLSVTVAGTTQTMLANETLAWTSRLAEQAVHHEDFDPDLVMLFDQEASAVPFQITVAQGASLSVEAGGATLPLYQAQLTADYGFVQYGDSTGSIVLARPVAIAQTATNIVDGQDVGWDAVVRLRQNGTDSLQLEIYRVDDLNGTVAGVAPGQGNYATLAAGRDYQTTSGTTLIQGPGYGQWTDVTIQGVKQGDILAMKLTDLTTNSVYWAFSQANQDDITHIYSYGLNTWGWEDTAGGGDGDFNDLVVGIDFTSLTGTNNWLA
ncbi:MAG: DUF4114 domain-containing protein [Reyranella sp.]|uniref:DUF4114 domain-containing protein n=1 Tax=Reyranella sp. TaxID=1929291 RepID=UPI003D0EAF6D